LRITAKKIVRECIKISNFHFHLLSTFSLGRGRKI
jgi:hypothetical protein